MPRDGVHGAWNELQNFFAVQLLVLFDRQLEAKFAERRSMHLHQGILVTDAIENGFPNIEQQHRNHRDLAQCLNYRKYGITPNVEECPNRGAGFSEAKRRRTLDDRRREMICPFQLG